MDHYKEALEKAREEYEKAREQGYTWLMGLLEGMFPDLKEGEDERIRKALIDGVRQIRCKNGITQEQMIDWLEKQKAKERLDRMAPIYNDKESFESALEKAWKYYNESASRTVDSFEDDYIECVFSKGFREGFLYKEKQKELPTNEEMLRTLRAEYEKGVADTIAKYEQKEQKFTEKQDYSDLTDLERAIHRGFLVVGVENVPVTIIKETAQDCLAWMKPAEWSEEDELMRTVIIQTLERFGGRGTTGMQIDWLKSLPERFNLQPKQEWTIEDAKPGDILHTSSTASSKTFIFNGIRNDEHGSVECFCCYDSEDGFRKGEEELIGWKTDKYRLATPKQCIKLGRIMGKAGYIFHFETNKLQKLNKLHWKPSDEQMYALQTVYEYLSTSSSANIELSDALRKLYNDLQKLL